MSETEEWEDDEWNEEELAWEDEEQEQWEESTGCTFSHREDEVCPECCAFGGMYQPGVEECEFCPWADECQRVWEKLRRGGRI